MSPTIVDATVNAALAAIESEEASQSEKIEMLIEIATRLLEKPKDTHQLHQSIVLYQNAIDLCKNEYNLLKARAMVGMGMALRAIGDETTEYLQQAKSLFEKALPLLKQYASPEEIAEAQMNLGFVLQGLVAFHQAKLTDCIGCYQQALQVFVPSAYPREYAILQNNIAIAYLSMSLDLPVAMALQTFEKALEWINLIDHPSEYAMLQNNLGNALQYAASNHPVENNLKAIIAYNEALKVRDAKSTPLEYANTIANKANALANLPDNLEHPELGNQNNLFKALAYYSEAIEIFSNYGQLQQAETVKQALTEINGELETLS